METEFLSTIALDTFPRNTSMRVRSEDERLHSVSEVAPETTGVSYLAPVQGRPPRFNVATTCRADEYQGVPPTLTLGVLLGLAWVAVALGVLLAAG